ncbi:MAG: acyl-CoA dehydratase activase [Spirochaetota bacterium]
MGIHVGVDIGSISVNAVVLDERGQPIWEQYVYCHGRPFQRVLEVFRELESSYATDGESTEIATLSFTGSGGATAAELLGGGFVNEVVAQSCAVALLHPDARTVIEMGGEDSKLLFMEPTPDGSELEDFVMNSICAAGTGSFLDQQARRVGVSIEDEFGRLALLSEDPPRIAGRCSVFAKSDMIHLQQIAAPVEDIVAGLCFAVARNFKSSMGRGREFRRPVVFQGGVSQNAGVVRAFREILDLHDGELIIPEHNTSMGAIGAVLNRTGIGRSAAVVLRDTYRGLAPLEEYLATQSGSGAGLPRLRERKEVHDKATRAIPVDDEPLDVYLGLDIGSLSTNVVLIDRDNQVVARRYLRTASRPLEAIRRGISEIAEEVGDRVVVRAAGTTGSGRYLTGDFIGADSIRNEITAQATAAIAHDPTVDTIFEIGGQDSKYISIRDGVVVDFEMNKVCAAGTGSFLEEQAEKLGIRIEEEFAELAFASSRPAHLGDRCTVFMESDLNSHQQKGASTEDLVGGLAYSIVHNFIQKVVGDKRIGDRIFFQGGVTNNRAVVAAFEAVTGKPITVPPHFDVTGAIGAAILARETVSDGRPTAFKGWEVSRRSYKLDKFTCTSCANQCEIRRVKIDGEKRPFFYGGRCEKWEKDDRKGRGEGIPNLFAEREAMLRGDYSEHQNDGRTTIGIPRALMLYWQQFPYWRTFFETLGFRVVVSRASDRGLVATSLENINAETCFPVELATGHVLDLFERGVDYVFLPFVVDTPAVEGNPTVNYNCPWVQTYPFMIRASLQGDERADRLLIPTIHMRYRPKVLRDAMTDFATARLGVGRRAVKAALVTADAAQRAFETACRVRGEEVLASLPEGKESVVLLGRPYNSGDPELNLRVVEKLIGLDVMPIPVDFLPLDEVEIFPQYSMMCWPNGQKIMAAAKYVADHPSLNAVCMSNFRCGPDSFIHHYIREELRAKPYLQLEVDEHSADAGMITRIEAFLDSLRGSRRARSAEDEPNYALRSAGVHVASSQRDRVLYIPHMTDASEVLAAASRSCGMNARALPMQDERDLELGRRYTSSRECFPMICTTGSFLRKCFEPEFDPAATSFFMPNHSGPCRFGQYNKLLDVILRRLGFEDINIVAPSNEDSYAGFSNGRPLRFRLAVIRGIVAVDLLRKFLQERRPYEAISGDVVAVYRRSLDRVVDCVEAGGNGIVDLLRSIAGEFNAIPMREVPRRPLVGIVGEIYMRDNSFCNGHLVERLEELGAETIMAPVREWITYSSYRWGRDARWKGRRLDVLRSRIQEFFQHAITDRLADGVRDAVEMERDVEVEGMLELCDPYVHHDYDGDPALAFGAAAWLARQRVSGIVNILPFTCMPGTLIASVSPAFRKDHDNIPWVNIAYDGQDDAGIRTRLEAFMHQTREFATSRGGAPARVWTNRAVMEQVDDRARGAEAAVEPDRETTRAELGD